jgi:hypothetical protein
MRRERGRGDGAQLRRHVRPDRVEQLLDRAQPFGQRHGQVVLAIDAVGCILFEPALRVPHGRPVAGAQHIEVFTKAQTRQRQQVAGHRPWVRADEHAATAEHGVAGEARPLRDQRIVVGGVTRREDRCERTHLRAFAEHDVDGATRGCERRAEAVRHRPGRFGVVVVVMRHGHAAKPPARLDRGVQRGEMLLQQRPRVDHPRRRVPDQPAVRPRQGQRPRVRCPHQLDVVVLAEIRQRLLLGRLAGLEQLAFAHVHGRDVS